MYKQLLLATLKPFSSYVTHIKVDTTDSYRVNINLATTNNKPVTVNIVISKTYLNIEVVSSTVKSVQEYTILNYKGGHLEQLGAVVGEQIKSTLFATTLAVGILRKVPTRQAPKVHDTLISKLIKDSDYTNFTITLLDDTSIFTEVNGYKTHLCIDDKKVFKVGNDTAKMTEINIEGSELIKNLTGI